MPDNKTETEFKIGDVVCYNSGGHPMTVIGIDENSVTCVWSVKGDAKSKSYPAEALKKTEAKPTTLAQIAEAAMKAREAKTQRDGLPDNS